ncbi:hypothetical protein [Methanimicrococcus blatticola]|uniref:Putative secreted protein n=1 Tax=Methanimicrococcus blatticola TaxID=91560 RepID=A0A484F6H6_9EURY|nr:hypothetical protein [Methanimicrococcus blatticola]MBZ3934963.1 hypothetical protein [Methanimicrococcus blatticola]MCC2508938.1 hypothetical protein [Methanimicrococcus blatticola]TDQ71033.1 putative secreted protein [Methanimicrococcus blatticola]
MPEGKNQEKESVYVIAHCLLNSLTRVKGIRRPEPFDTTNKKVIQLPCPELIYAGPERGRKTKEDYDTPDYRALCLELFLPYADMIEKLSKDGHEIKITGVPKSPSCGVLTTTVQTSAESESSSENGIVESKGILIEEIEKELIRRHVSFEMSE